MGSTQYGSLLFLAPISYTVSAAAIVGYAVVSAYKDAILNSSYPAATPIDYCWRLLIGIGCVPGVIALYFRLTIPETPRFIMDVERNVVQATEDIRNVLNTGTYVVNRDAPVEHVIAPMATHRDMITYFSRWENLKILVATAYSWFALDVSIGLHLLTCTHYTIGRILRSRTE